MGQHQADQHSSYKDPRRKGEREKAETLFEEIMAENFPHLAQDKNLQFQEAEQILNRRSIVRYVITNQCLFLKTKKSWKQPEQMIHCL